MMKGLKMNKIKQFATISVAIILCFSLMACSDNSSQQQSDVDNVVTENNTNETNDTNKNDDIGENDDTNNDDDNEKLEEVLLDDIVIENPELKAYIDEFAKISTSLEPNDEYETYAEAFACFRHDFLYLMYELEDDTGENFEIVTQLKNLCTILKVNGVSSADLSKVEVPEEFSQMHNKYVEIFADLFGVYENMFGILSEIYLIEEKLDEYEEDELIQIVSQTMKDLTEMTTKMDSILVDFEQVSESYDDLFLEVLDEEYLEKLQDLYSLEF